MVSALSAQGLEHAYPGGVRALRGVDLELEYGELVCILGPNGSGKSTLLRACGGLLRPALGDVRIEGRALADFAPRERARRVATVPQGLRALPEVSVEGFVLAGRYPHQGLWARERPGDRAAVERALEETGAGGWRERGVGELSGGEFQRVLVARALAQEAPVLLFDEPTSSLDPEHQVRLFELVRSLVRADRAALVATHELALASRFADRILILAGGSLVAAGPAAGPGNVMRPEILGPVFGPDLLITEDPGSSGRVVVLPWPGGAHAGGSAGAALD